MMAAHVVDTNVAMVANGDACQAGPQCVATCIEALTQAISALVVIDDGMQILQEYLLSVGHAGQPGVGHAFVKWVFENQFVESRCERVQLTESPANSSNFSEFPNDPALEDFDASDRKVAAAALASANSR